MKKIRVKAKDLYTYVYDLQKDETIEAVEISIFDYEDDEGKTNTYLTIDILENAGLGLISNGESIKEMTPEEILDIP